MQSSKMRVAANRFQIARSVFEAIRSRSRKPEYSEDHGQKVGYDRLASLSEDFYEPESGLLNEGIYHNAIHLMALAHGQAHFSIDPMEIGRLSSSLEQLNYNTGQKLFRTRTCHEAWDHSETAYSRIKHDKNHFRPNEEFRCASQAIAALAYLAAQQGGFISLKSSPVHPRSVLESVEQQFKHNINNDECAFSKISNHFVGEYRAVDCAMVALAVKALTINDGIEPEDALFTMLTQSLHGLRKSFGYAEGRTRHPYLCDHDTEQNSFSQKRFLWQEVWILLALAVQADTDEPVHFANDCHALLAEMLSLYICPDGYFLNVPWSDREMHSYVMGHIGDNLLFMNAVEYLFSKGIASQLQVDTVHSAVNILIDKCSTQNVGHVSNGINPKSGRCEPVMMWGLNEVCFGTVFEWSRLLD